MTAPATQQLQVPPHEAGRLDQVRSLMNDVQGFLENGVRSNGPVYSIHPLGLARYVIVADSAVISDFYSQPDGVLTDYPANAFVEPLFGRNSVIFQDGKELLRVREVMMRLFREIELTTYLDVLEEEIREDFAARMQLPDSEIVIDLKEFFRGCFRRANIRIIFGATNWDAMEKASDDLLESLSTVTSLFGRQWAYALKLSHPRKCRREVDALILDRWETVREQQRRGEAEENTGISMLAAMAEVSGRFDSEAVCDLLFSMFLTGYIPPGSTAAWSMYRGMENPGIKEAVMRECQSGSARTPVMDSLFFEVLRWHNPLPYTSRTAAKSFSAGGYDWPAGTRFMIASHLVHRFDAAWEAPEEFRADRFQKVGMPMACPGFVPFGGGAHRCLGMHMAPVLNRKCLTTFLSLCGDDLEMEEPESLKSQFYAGTAIPSAAIRVKISGMTMHEGEGFDPSAEMVVNQT